MKITIITEKCRWDNTEEFFLKENYDGSYDIHREFEVDTDTPDYHIMRMAAAGEYFGYITDETKLCRLAWPEELYNTLECLTKDDLAYYREFFDLPADYRTY